MATKTTASTRTSPRANAPATTNQSVNGTPWRLPKKPSDPAKTSQAHILANSDTPRVMRVCYTTGPEGSFVAARANTKGGGNVASNIYLGGCIDIGGTDVELTNPNAEPAAGIYELVPVEKK